MLVPPAVVGAQPVVHAVAHAPELPGANGPCAAPKIHTDPVTGVSRRVIEKGKFHGAHDEAYNHP